MVLEKTPESSLDSKEIKSVNPKGNQPCILIGRTDTEAQILWPPDVNSWLNGKCWERLKAGEGGDKGWDGWMASPTQWTWVWADSGRWWRSGRPGVLQLMGLQSRTRRLNNRARKSLTDMPQMAVWEGKGEGGKGTEWGASAAGSPCCPGSLISRAQSQSSFLSVSLRKTLQEKPGTGKDLLTSLRSLNFYYWCKKSLPASRSIFFWKFYCFPFIFRSTIHLSPLS